MSAIREHEVEGLRPVEAWIQGYEFRTAEMDAAEEAGDLAAVGRIGRDLGRLLDRVCQIEPVPHLDAVALYDQDAEPEPPTADSPSIGDEWRPL